MALLLYYIYYSFYCIAFSGADPSFTKIAESDDERERDTLFQLGVHEAD